MNYKGGRIQYRFCLSSENLEYIFKTAKGMKTVSDALNQILDKMRVLSPHPEKEDTHEASSKSNL